MAPITPENLYHRLQNIKAPDGGLMYPLPTCVRLTPLINEINRLKREQNAVILAHTYTTPEIIYGVADFVGDSYALSKDAMATDAPTIVFAAVRFMAETAKILNPDKQVLLPAVDGGCTLADGITAAEVRVLRQKHPDYTFVCYINTTAEVKAACDVCVTSGNIVTVIANMPDEKIFFLPDGLMAHNLIRELGKRNIKKDIRYHHGTCYAHEEFTVADVRRIKDKYPQIKVAAHPECKPEVCALADFIGSTAQILDYMRTEPHQEFLMLTEEGLGNRLSVEFPQKRLLGPRKICRYMKSNTLESILDVLKQPQPSHRIEVPEPIRVEALRCLKAMFAYTERSSLPQGSPNP